MEGRYKLLLTKSDRDTFMRLIDGREVDALEAPRLIDTYSLFEEQLQRTTLSFEQILAGLGKLLMVDIALKKDHDNPQLIFESLSSNRTGFRTGSCSSVLLPCSATSIGPGWGPPRTFGASSTLISLRSKRRSTATARGGSWQPTPSSTVEDPRVPSHPEGTLDVRCRGSGRAALPTAALDWRTRNAAAVRVRNGTRQQQPAVMLLNDCGAGVCTWQSSSRAQEFVAAGVRARRLRCRDDRCGN